MSPISEFPPYAVKRPVMFQSWTRLTFLHWRYRSHAIRRLLPKGLAVDTFDGSAWVGLTPFLIEGLRPPFLPALPWISRFPEMNVRTYVRGPDGRPGVWFFTLEADRLAAVAGARLTYGLPYRWAAMRVRPRDGTVEYESSRRQPFGSAEARICVEVGDAIKPTELEKFLTARFRLYTVLFGRLGFAQIEHDPWPLRTARLVRLTQDVIRASGVPEPTGEPMLLYSPAINVRVGRVHTMR
jgi:uncharacterized protein